MKRLTGLKTFSARLSRPGCKTDVIVPVLATRRENVPSQLRLWFMRGWFLKSISSRRSTAQAVSNPEESEAYPLQELAMDWEQTVKTVKTAKAEPSTPAEPSEAAGLKDFIRIFWAGRSDHAPAIIRTIRSQLRWAIQELRALRKGKTK